MTLTPTAPAITVTPLSGVIGATIHGIDARRPLTDVEVEAVRSALLRHKVVFLPGQHLDPAQHVAFARHFGEVTPAHPVLPGIEGHPEVFEIDYGAPRRLAATYGDVAGAGQPRRRGLDWHTDVTFVERPPLGSILNAVTIPPSGGDTLWSNQAAAFADLSPALQAFLETLTAVHDGKAAFGAALKQCREGEWDGEKYTALEPAEHPVVRVHPETGEKVLFVNKGFTSHLKGLTRAESDTLLAFLLEHSTKPEYTVRYHWTAGDLGFWDNRATQHSVVGDYGDQARVIQRVTLRGDRPAGVRSKP
jgi:alpha-ketoglutarate-dependent taurine dioxygenase